MKKLRSHFIILLVLVHLAASVLADIMSWILTPALFESPNQESARLLSVAIRTGITLVIFVIFVVIGINELTDPISRISAAAQKIAEGDFDVQIPKSRRKDEIGRLEKSFAIMVKELKSNEAIQKDFIRNVSHEFKTPLTVISGYARMLAKDVMTAEERVQCSLFIAEEAERISKMTSNILLLSKLENQSIVPQFTGFSLDEQMRQIILTFEAKWREKSINLDIDLDPVIIQGNEELLTHVWSNLIDNAIKYSNHHGNVSIRVRTDGVNAYTVIKDEGIGMDEETLKHAYGQFYQGDTSREDLGSGLGLSLAKRIILLHSGTISAVSKQEQGAAFTVVLPIKQ